MPGADPVACGGHPTADELAAFLHGRLTPAEVAALEPHVAECAACCRVLRGLPDDGVVAALRAPGPADAGAEAVDPARELADHPRYRVLEFLGAGGMGAVYTARHLLMDRVVALKVVHRRLTRDPAAVERFRQEVRAAARLAHPNIVTAHDADQAGDRHFLVMEYIAGQSLARRVAERGPLPVAAACEYVRQAALGLQHAFEHGMVHRDVKPQNLMLTPAGRVKILDFGLAHIGAGDPAPAAADTASDLTAAAGTQTGLLMGTPDYMAPEQGGGARRVDIRADVYGLGCTLYFLLAGWPPFPEGTAAAKLAAHRADPPQPLTEVRDDVPAALARVVDRMLAKDPARRFQTPADVARALAQFAGAAQTRFGRRLWLAAAAGGLIVAGAVLVRPLLRTDSVPPAVGEVRRFDGHSDHVWCVALSADGRHALSASGDQTVRLWDVTTGRELRRFVGHEAEVTGVVISPDGRTALSGAGDETVRVWDVATGRELRRLDGHNAKVEAVAFSPDGRRALTGGYDGTARLWDVATGRELLRLTGHADTVRWVDFSPDGRRALTGGWDNLIILWDLDTGRPVRRLAGHTDRVNCVRFSPDGRRAVSAGGDSTVRVWDVDTGAEVGRLAHEAVNGVHAVAWLPDGRRVVSAGGPEVRVWDVAAGRELHRLRGHSSKVWSVVVSADGRHLLSGGQDGTVRLWRID
jgi:predicted Ser/Thr protein kinase